MSDHQKHRARALAIRTALAAAAVHGCSCVSSPPPPPATPTATPTRAGPRDPEVAPEALWKEPESLNVSRGLAPQVERRLQDLERDYFGGQFVYVIQEARELLDLAGKEPRMRLRLYYLLARSHARNRDPAKARHYEELFRELFTELHQKPPRGPADAARVAGLVERSEQLFQGVHPGWDLDADGEMWANVRVWRRLDREGPHAVISEEHPGGGVIHASLSAENLKATLQDLGLFGPDTVLERDQRFGFYYLIQEQP